jgi:hypothetical protein
MSVKKLSVRIDVGNVCRKNNNNNNKNENECLLSGTLIGHALKVLLKPI